MFDLKGKVAVITGGANGIGAATLRMFLDEGAKFVAFVDIDETSGLALEKELQKQHGKDALKFFKCDVTKDEELFHVFDDTVKNQGYIDVVFNNAGIGNDAKHKREIEINFTALVTSTLKALEIMRKDKGGAGGTIINVSSSSAMIIQNTPTVYVYCATKSAVLMFGANLGMESYYAYTGVRVITMCFGLTTTDVVTNLTGIDDISTEATHKFISTMTLQPPEVAAAGVVEAYKKGKTGSVWHVGGSKITDITERVSKAYQVLSGQIQV